MLAELALFDSFYTRCCSSTYLNLVLLMQMSLRGKSDPMNLRAKSNSFTTKSQVGPYEHLSLSSLLFCSFKKANHSKVFKVQHP